MNTFILIIIAIGILAIPVVCLFTFLTLVNKKWKYLLKYSLISLVLALICTTMGLISYNVLESDTTISNTAISTVQPPSESIDSYDLSNDSFVEDVKSVIQGTVGSGEAIQSVSFENRNLCISVDLGETDSCPIPAKELAFSRTGSITDQILNLYEYDALWDTITIDFGDLGYIKNFQKDIRKNEYGMRYFPEENFKLINGLREQPMEAVSFPESSDEIIENNRLSENTTKVSIEDMITLIESVLIQSFGKDNYTITCDRDNKIIYLNVWYDGIIAELTAIKLSGGDATDEDWMTVKRSIVNNAKSVCNFINECGYEDFNLSYNVLNDMNHENILLSVVNTTIIYDVMEDE